MNLIRQEILTAVLVFIGSLVISYLILEKINWILSIGVASGILIGTLLGYLWMKDVRRKK